MTKLTVSEVSIQNLEQIVSENVSAYILRKNQAKKIVEIKLLLFQECTAQGRSPVSGLRGRRFRPARRHV